MTDFVNTIDLYGDEIVAAKIVGRTIEEYNDDIIASIGDSAFRNCSALTSVYLPSVETISGYAFQKCTALSEINMPKLIGDRSSNTNHFSECTNLRVAHIPLLESINGNMFYKCSSIERVEFPKASTTSSSAFAFASCTALKEVVMLKDLSATKIFQGCTNLDTLIFRNYGVCKLSNINSFEGTPFASGGTGGKVYVRSANIESYKTATNWSSLYAAGTCTFLPLEDYTVDGTYTGAIDWNKINGGATA